jgi:ribonuclease R
VTVQVARVDLEARKIDLVLAESEQKGMPAPLERARAAAVEATGSKPPRRRKAKEAANGRVAAVPASPQQVHGMKGEPPVPPDFSRSDETEDDIVFVPPTRSGRSRSRKSGSGNGSNGSGGNSGNNRNAAPAPKKAAAKQSAAKQSAPSKSAAKAPRAASKTSKKK